MNKKFTKLIAALALLVFMMPSLAGWGQTKSTTGTLDMSTSQTSPVTNNDVTFTWTSSNIVTGGGNSSGFKANSNMTVTIPSGTTLKSISKTNGNNWGSGATIKVYAGTNNSGTEIASIVTGTNSYTISANNTGTTYYFENSTTKNAWIKSLSIEYEGSGSTVATPTFDPAEGTYTSAQNVTISCTTQDATIYYTTDGSTPDNNSTEYTAAIPVSTNTTIKAIAYVGNDASSVASATYTFLTPLTTMQAIYDANSTSTDQVVAITFDNWIITANYSSYAFLSDGDKGLLIFGSGHGFVQGDILSGTVVCKLNRYTGMARLTQLTSQTAGIHVEQGANPTPTVTTINTVEGINTGKLITLNGLTCHVDGTTYSFTDEENRTVYPYSWGGLSGFRDYLSDGKTYDVTGVFCYGNSTDEKRINPRSVTEIMPTPATLPFSWTGGGKTALMAFQGVTAYGLGSDYADANAPYLVKFDGTGDYILVRTDSQPDVVTIGVKMIGGSATSKITVQASTDGVNFDAGQELTISGSSNAELELTSTRTFGADVRYVKMLFTKGSNVGVGPISITKVSTEPYVTLSDYEIDAPYTGVAESSISITYGNLPEDYSFDIKFCDANGDELEGDGPDWIYAAIEEDNVDYIIDANHGEARTAYFKVSASWLVEVGDDVEIESVYSELVTVSQAAAPEPSITIANATVNVDADEHDGTLDLTYENLPITDLEDFDVQYYDAEGEEIATANNPDWIEVLVAEQDPEIGEGYVVSYVMLDNEGEARSAYFKVYALDDDVELVYSNLVTINQEEAALPSIVDGWVLTDLADLTEDDIFVIVGDNGNTYAMSNDEGTQSSPAAVAVTVVEGTLSGEPADNLKWNISITDNGYTFYPNGTTETWLYCTNTNTGVRVGTNDNKTFVVEDGYLKHVATSRFVGIYNSQDWRCYTSHVTTGSNQNNIEGQTFAFYKKVSANVQTYDTTLTVYTSNTQRWHLIASPLAGSVKAGDVTNLKSNTYDLYRFDQTQDKEWQNYKKHGFYIESGKGYLYANSGDGENETVTLTFTGQPYDGDGIVPLTYSTTNSDENMWGWNLIGNPFGTAATLNMPFFKMNEAGSGFTAQIGANSPVAAMEGVLVYAYDDANPQAIPTATFTATRSNSEAVAMVNIDVEGNMGAVMDNAIVNFNEGLQLPKFYFGESNANIYIPQGNKDYAIVSAEAQGEMPVNFKAAENGTYTLTVNPEGVEMNYLHLIDNMTGANIDLLQTPSYTFNATTRDYESRFRLVFATSNSANANSEADSFAFFSNGSWIINNVGEATLQVIDITGRILSSETVNGSVSTTVNAAPGVYMIRLINGNDVKTQKIVVR